jgi:hypothetical protein
LKVILYYLRVFFVSFEFLILLSSGYFYMNFPDFVLPIIKTPVFDSEAFKWFVLYPVCLAVWVFKSGVSVLFPNDSLSKKLHAWPGYWKLKAHFNVGLIYCVIWGALSLIVWAYFSGEGSIFMLWTAVLGSSVSALSFYMADIRIKEILMAGE